MMCALKAFDTPEVMSTVYFCYFVWLNLISSDCDYYSCTCTCTCIVIHVHVHVHV